MELWRTKLKRKSMFKKTTLVFIFMVVLVSQTLVHLPDFIKWKTTPSGLWFTGQVSWFDPWDQNVYFSAIGWGRRAGLVFQNLYDTQSDKPMQIYAAYTALGKILGSLPISNAVIFHLSAIVLNFFLAFIVWWFLSIFLNKDLDKKIAFVLIFLGGGLGWLLFPQIVLPDLGQPGFMFESATRRPHETISIGLFLLTFGVLWKGIIGKQNVYLIIGLVSSFLAFYFHPYSVITFGVVISSFGAYFFLKEKNSNFWKGLAVLAVSGLLYLLFFGRQMLIDPSSSGLVGQVQYSPNPMYAILGWGILFPFILIALFSPSLNQEIRFLKFWFLGHFAIIYIPLGFQKLLIRGLWVVAVILAVVGVGILAKRAKLKHGVLLIFVVAFACISNFFIFAKKVSEPITNRWVYLFSGEREIIDYLNSNGQKEEGVLASYRVGNIIPANTDKRVWAGHEFQTPNFKTRIQEVNKFYSGGMDDQEAREFLKNAKIAWVFWGPDEKTIGGLEKIPNSDLFDPVLQDGNASLFSLKN